MFIPRSFCLPQGEVEVEMGEDTQQDESGLLTIHNVTRAHAGLYQCTADNGMAPPASAEVQLVVQCECKALVYCGCLSVNLEIAQTESANKENHPMEICQF